MKMWSGGLAGLVALVEVVRFVLGCVWLRIHHNDKLEARC
jgi:hypothetical protein